MSSVLFLFLSHLGIGVVGTLLLVGESVGVKFFRFNAGLASALLLSALVFWPENSLGEMNGVTFWTLALATAAVVIYWGTVGRVLSRLRPVLLWTAAIGGVTALGAQGHALSAADMGPWWPVLTIASFLSSAALLGGTCTAMILGHWYLVLPSMDVSLLQFVVKFHIASTLLRIVVVAMVVWVALTMWEAPSGAGYARYIWSLDGVFLWQRVLFGLLGPAVLAFLTWETAKIRSTQSATGILYVDFFAVMVGEILAKYLLLSTRVPV